MKRTKIVSLLLTVLLVLTMMPVAAFALDSGTMEKGTSSAPELQATWTTANTDIRVISNSATGYELDIAHNNGSLTGFQLNLIGADKKPVTTGVTWKERADAANVPAASQVYEEGALDITAAGAVTILDGKKLASDGRKLKVQLEVTVAATVNEVQAGTYVVDVLETGITKVTVKGVVGAKAVILMAPSGMAAAEEKARSFGWKAAFENTAYESLFATAVPSVIKKDSSVIVADTDIASTLTRNTDSRVVGIFVPEGMTLKSVTVNGVAATVKEAIDETPYVVGTGLLNAAFNDVVIDIGFVPDYSAIDAAIAKAEEDMANARLFTATGSALEDAIGKLPATKRYRTPANRTALDRAIADVAKEKAYPTAVKQEDLASLLEAVEKVSLDIGNQKGTGAGLVIDGAAVVTTAGLVVGPTAGDSLGVGSVSVTEFKALFVPGEGNKVVLYSGGTEVTSGVVGTGMEIRLVTNNTDATLLDSAFVVVKGDLADVDSVGDGKTTSADLLVLARGLIGTPSAANAMAGDLAGSGENNDLADGFLTSADLLALARLALQTN